MLKSGGFVFLNYCLWQPENVPLHVYIGGSWHNRWGGDLPSPKHMCTDAHVHWKNDARQWAMLLSALMLKATQESIIATVRGK